MDKFVKFSKCVVKEDRVIKCIEVFVDSETYEEVKYRAYLNKTSDRLLFVNHMTFTDYDVKVEALVNPIFAIKYDMLMEYIGEDSFTTTELGRINAQVYLLNEVHKNGTTDIVPYLDVMSINKFVIPVLEDREKVARVRSWINFIQTCFISALLNADWENKTIIPPQKSKVANHDL